MRHLILAALIASTASLAAAAPTPKEQLLVPPANAEHFVIVSEAGKHGDAWRWTQADGSLAYRESILLRGLIFEQDEVVKLDPNGLPVLITVRGVTPNGDAAETFTLDSSGTARWVTQIDKGEKANAGGQLYLPNGGTLIASDIGAAALVKAGEAGLATLPSGIGAMKASKTVILDGPNGRKAAHLYFTTGVGQSPSPIWLDDNMRLVAVNQGLGIMPSGYEQHLRKLTAAQEEAIAEMAPAFAAKYLSAGAKAPILFRDVKIFDADKGRFLAHQNVVVADGKIQAVGDMLPKLTAGTRVIDGAGKTLVPGLWDSHMHLGDDFQALQEVALGVTSARNPGGTPIELVQSMVKRRAAGQLVSPEMISSVIVDSAGPLAAQGSITVSSEAEALAAVRKIKDAGLQGVKFYTSMKPEWIAPAAKLAHQLGLHVHGHIPAGMRTLDAVDAGYDEITHLYFATMQAMPQYVVDKSNTTLRLTGPAKHFKDVDFGAEPTKTVIRTLAAKKIAVDPTLVVIERVLLAQPGTIIPAYKPYEGILPPAVERGLKSGPLPLPEGTSRADAAASFAHMLKYVKALRDGGVTILAGTDGAGPEIVRELELYVEGGMTPAEALASATIVPATEYGASQRTGSIAKGKEADLLLVDGDVEADIGNLRHVDRVVLDGALIDGKALRADAGISGMPKFQAGADFEAHAH